MTPVPAMALEKEGKLRMVATLLSKRSGLAPDVPTMAEAGMQGVSVAPWLGLFAPAKLPQQLPSGLSREFNAALRRSEIQDMLARQGFEAQGSTPAELATHVKDQIDAWARVVRDAKIPME
jgi:tripartite-type tricarboxylate transporter receptor subunit TctC